MDQEKIRKYLERIGFQGTARADRETLFQLHEVHFKTVPYENLDIFLYGKVADLDAESVYEKIVNNHRGGYCFELNGLFAELLRGVGFQVQEFFARWHFGEKESVPHRRHRVLKVTVPDTGESFIADIGVGCDCPFVPLEFREDLIQERNGRNYRIVFDEQLGVVVQTSTAEGFTHFYSFNPVPVFPQDFDYAHFWCCKGEGSPFRDNLMVCLATDRGKIRIDKDEAGNWITRHAFFDHTHEDRIIADEKEMEQILKEIFGISCTIPALR